MKSNLSSDPANKGSKYLIQKLFKQNNEAKLTQEIQKADPTVGNITWISPLASEQFKEYKLNYKSIREKLGLKAFNMKFWPSGQPQWDAIGIVKNQNGAQDTLILVEAKAHISEIKTPCGAKADDSIKLIQDSLRKTHDDIRTTEGLKSINHTFKQDLWMGLYYQVGNRLVFLNELKQQGYSVKLVFLNFVNDPTLIKTSETEWLDHYKSVFTQMLGFPHPPKDVIVINMIV